MDGGWQRDWYGRPVGGTCCQDDSFCSWQKEIPALYLLFFLTLCPDNGAKRFVVSKSCRDITEDSREFSDILWCVSGGQDVVPYPSAEPDVHMFVHVKQ